MLVLLNCCNVVVVNGGDDIEMWSRPYTLYNACDTAIGLELDSKRLSLRTSVAREETSDSIQVDFMKRLRSFCYSDFIHTYRTLNARGYGV